MRVRAYDMHPHEKSRMDEIKMRRNFMKGFHEDDDYESDQMKKLPQPPLEKAAVSKELIELPKDFSNILVKRDLVELIENRKSNRVYTDQSLTLAELSFLLWATQGVKEIRGKGSATIRTVPSGGARHAFETYLAVNRVDGLKPGIYHYLAIEHSLEFLFEVEDLAEAVSHALCDQKFAGKSAVTFLWSVIPYRGEWRYYTDAHKVMLLDAGHMCQNLYLACEAIGCGTCAIGAFEQIAVDRLLKLDGEEEFTVYAAPVGKV